MSFLNFQTQWVFVSATFCLIQVFVSLHKRENNSDSSRFPLGFFLRNISNLFTLNVRGQYITHESCLGESKDLRVKNKKKTLKFFHCPATASRSEVVTAWCCSSETCQTHCGGVGVQNKEALVLKTAVQM